MVDWRGQCGAAITDRVVMNQRKERELRRREFPDSGFLVLHYRRVFVSSLLLADYEAVLLGPRRREGSAEAAVSDVRPAGGEQESTGGKHRQQRVQRGEKTD